LILKALIQQQDNPIS